MQFLGLYLGSHRRLFSILLFLSHLLFMPYGGLPAIGEELVYGPENLLRTLPNPFNTRADRSAEPGQSEEDALAPLAIKQNTLQARGLKERFNAPKLFLPERIAIGKTAEFLIKAPAGMYVAIAMADKNSGAKPICGHPLRLGSDRKVVAVGKVPDAGIISLYVEAPIQGDLIGESLFFEAAIWSKPDFSDLQIATTISPQQTVKENNAVVIAADVEQKKRGLFVFDQPEPLSTREYPGSVVTSKP